MRSNNKLGRSPISKVIDMRIAAPIRSGTVIGSQTPGAGRVETAPAAAPALAPKNDCWMVRIT